MEFEVVAGVERGAGKASAEQERRLRDRARSLWHVQGRIERQRQQLSVLHALVEQLNEPTETVTCGKVRLRDRREAQDFGEYVEKQTLKETGRVIPTEPYACKKCPRHPFTLQRFWHIRRRKTAHESYRKPSKHVQRADRVTERGEMRGDAPRQQVTPADIARLKEKLG